MVNGSGQGDEAPVNVSEWIANAIADTGCSVVYGGHGGALVPMVDAVVKHPKLKWVSVRNEHDAATMAAAHAKMTGGLGCVIATSGPGATNLTTGLLEAVMDKCSLLAITGMKPSAVLGYSEFQDLNQSRLFAGAGIEWSKSAASAAGVIPLLRDAVATALSRRTCAHLSIPVDIQAALSPLPLKHFCASHADLRLRPMHLDQVQLREAAEAIVGIPEQRPPRNVIAVGLRGSYNEKPDSNVSEAILDLAEALNAPVLTRLDAKGVVDEWHPLSFGVIGVHGKPGLEAAAGLVSTAECVISIGVEDETLLVCNTAGLQIRRLIEIQPDAVAIGTRYNAEYTLMGNVEDICRSLKKHVETIAVKVREERDAIAVALKKELSRSSNTQTLRRSSVDQYGYMAHNNPTAFRRKSTIDSIVVEELLTQHMDELGLEELEKKTDLMWDAMHNGRWRKLLPKAKDGTLWFKLDKYQSSDGYCHPATVLEQLSALRADESTNAVSRNATVCVDVGDITLWASLCLHLRGNSRTLYSEHLGTMGYGLNAGIAAILSHPEPAGAVVLTGDGAFQMTLQEMATFQQLKRPGDKLLCIVFDNKILGRVAFGFDNALGCEMIGPDYVQLAKAYGGDGVLLDSDANAKEVLKRALETEGLYMIHVMVDPQVKADMASFKDNAIEVMNSG